MPCSLHWAATDDSQQRPIATQRAHAPSPDEIPAPMLPWPTLTFGAGHRKESGSLRKMPKNLVACTPACVRVCARGSAAKAPTEQRGARSKCSSAKSGLDRQAALRSGSRLRVKGRWMQVYFWCSPRSHRQPSRPKGPNPRTLDRSSWRASMTAVPWISEYERVPCIHTGGQPRHGHRLARSKGIAGQDP